MEHWIMAGRLVLAAICGGIIGWEREWRKKPAGLRTHMLVAVGSASFTLGAVRFVESSPGGANSLDLDPTRVVQGIVGGIGFLGAGAIVRSRGSVEGLTTAAGVWVMGAIGVACGLGYYALAIETTILTIFIVAGLGLFTDRFSRPPHLD